MSLFHRHLWRVVEKETHPSAMEQLKAAGVTSLKGMYEDHFERAVIVTYSCSCGAEKVERL